MIKQGIILAGGEGTRLKPLTNFYNKGLVDINGKFIIDFPLETLLKLGVKDLIVILGGSHFAQIVSHIQDGRAFGFNSVSYVYQNEPSGISQAINLCEKLIYNDQFFVILGDNIFDGDISFDDYGRYGAQIVLSRHKELNRFGVASVKDNKIHHIEEKPKTIDMSYDNFAITGLYLFDRQFFNYFTATKKSDRGEFEIVDIMNKYQEDGCLGFTITDGLWADAGTIESIKHLSDYFWNKGIK